MGVSWSRVQQGAVEQCTCVHGQMECGRVQHKSKALLCTLAVALHGVGIKDNEGIKA